ncbi:MAG: hypothetical protein J6T74_05015 [Clostridia bacterium]|nr:hypothetical protein [Clostridia bacterium]
MFYWITIAVLILLYISAIKIMKNFTNIKLTNSLLCIFIFLFYITGVLIVYLDVGANDWNFTNTLPVANVSPFMFFTSPIFFVLSQKLKKYYLTLIALLSVGMILSPIISCIYFASISYRFIPHFLLDFFAHFLLSIWGVYIVRTNQIDLKRKQCLISAMVLVFVATTMLILNVIFDTAFFGLSLNGKHNIYNFVIVENSVLSALIYFLGLCLCLFFGYLLQTFINKRLSKIVMQKNI